MLAYAAAMVAIILAIVLVAVATFAVVRLAFLHPLQLWSVPWAVSTSLFAMHLLPYRPLSASTALLIAGCTACFATGVAVAARTHPGGRLRGWEVMTRAHDARASIETAAGLAVALTAVGLTLFLAELTARYGLRDAIVNSPRVRLDLAAGAADVTIKYLYVGYAAAALCGLAAALAVGPARRLWLGLGTLVVLSQYFNTGRSNIVLAALVFAVAEAVARGRRPFPRRLLAGAATLAVFVLAIFTIGGAIIGKTLANNQLADVASPLTEHRLLRPFALPYQYASAPLPALERQLAAAASTRDAYGCATFSTVCRIGASAGLDVTPEPLIRPFTRAPLPWNTYTALDLPLIDGGAAFALVFFTLIGWLSGALWQRARAGMALSMLLYAIYSSALLYSVIQNNFFAPHVVGACLLTALLLWAGRGVSRRRTVHPHPHIRRARLLGGS